jgi:hypothetical protein
MYDKAADSNPLRLRLNKLGIGLIRPHRSNRKRPVLVRYEWKSKMFRLFREVACLMSTLRQL